jgi:hypothetical protein
VLKLMFGALIRAAERGRSVKVTEFKRRQLASRKELDQASIHTFKGCGPVKIASSSRT